MNEMRALQSGVPKSSPQTRAREAALDCVGAVGASRRRGGHVRARPERTHPLIMRTVALALALLALAASGQAQCDETTSQAALTACAQDALDHADAELNAVYAQTLKALSGRGVVELRAAQRAWIRFRDLDCETVRSASEGGSIAPYELARCLTDHTTARVTTLRARYLAHAVPSRRARVDGPPRVPQR